ncbi:hypothetical protein ACROYT_G019293 [Oculina patagonica]
MNEIPRNRKKSCLIRLTAVKERRDLTFRYHLKLEAADALSQADALGSKIGYARYVVRPKDLTARFSKLVVNSKTFFKNNVEVDKWVRHRLFSKLRKTVDKEKWPMFPQTINAMYQFYENEIVIPAGILQSPFFYSAEVPRSLSYGALGSIIGHEITHGFDNTGRKFDKNGDIVKEWWSKPSLVEFNKKSKCIEEQYSQYKVQGKYLISGKVTLGENIADNGGTKLSYFAYHDWLQKHGTEEFALPGLEYTNEQLFFIGYAQEYCSHARPKTEYIATLSEIHAPPKFRVIGTLSNFKEFSEAFNCPVNSTMNPEKKCEAMRQCLLISVVNVILGDPGAVSGDGLNNNDESMRKTTSCKKTSESLFWSTPLIGHKNIFVANQEEGVQTLLELVR